MVAVDKIMPHPPTKDVHILIPRLDGKRVFTDVTKGRSLRWNGYPLLPWWTHVITRGLIRRRQEGQSQRRRCDERRRDEREKER